MCKAMGGGREQTLATLHTAATEIQACDSVQEACERTVEAAEEILDFEMCSLLLHEDGWLDPVAVSSQAPPDGARRMRADQGLAGKTFQTEDSYLIEDVEADEASDPAKAVYRSGISVPIGSVGVFQAVATDVGGFDAADLELAELLVAHTARTIDRLEFERELEAQREALREQNERLERFTSIVSHDLRSPLNVAAGRLELARMDCESEHLDAVADAHERMEALIDDLLTLARDGGPVDELEPVDLATLTQECWQTVRSEEATLDLEADLRIHADRRRLRQLIENLLRNAVDHADERVVITVGSLPEESGFYVADDGPGIPPGERDQALEWGYSTSDEGTGFGLAIVQEIVDAHGWQLAITESTSEGARVEITDVEVVG